MDRPEACRRPPLTALRLAGATLVLVAFGAGAAPSAAAGEDAASPQAQWKPKPVLAPPPSSAPPPPPVDADATPLSKPEAALQGSWSDTTGWQIVFKGHTFSAAAGETWYTGTFSAPASDDDPAPLDIAIADCNCKYKGQLSQSIYRWQGAGLKMSGATPDTPRPPDFDDTLGLVLDLTRVAGAKAP